MTKTPRLRAKPTPAQASPKLSNRHVEISFELDLNAYEVLPNITERGLYQLVANLLNREVDWHDRTELSVNLDGASKYCVIIGKDFSKLGVTWAESQSK